MGKYILYQLLFKDYSKPKCRLNYLPGETIAPEIYKEAWVVVRNSKEFLSCIKENGLPKVISFGKLSMGEDENAENEARNECEEWLVDYCKKNKIKYPYLTIAGKKPLGGDSIDSLMKFLERFNRD